MQDVNSKADLAACIRQLETALDEDQGGATRSWSHLIDQCEAIESHAYDMGIIRKRPVSVWRPKEVYLRNGQFDYLSPFKRIVKEIRKRVDAIKKKLKMRAQDGPGLRRGKWWKLREYLLNDLPKLPESYEERLAAMKDYNQQFAHTHPKIEKVDTIREQVRYITQRLLVRT